MKVFREVFVALVILMALTTVALAADYPESVHPYASNSDISWTYEHCEEAYALKITFSEDTEFESGYDYLYITGADTIEQSFTGTSLAGESIYVLGNSFSLRLTSDSSVNHNGFAITNIEVVTQAEYDAFINAPKFTITSNGTITAYKGQVENLVIPEVIDGIAVTRIGSSAFSGNTALKSIVLPCSVTSVANFAFEGCKNLLSVNVPEGVTTIGNSVFSRCSSLTNIDIPDTVTTIGNSAFSRCSSLTNINIPDTVTTIGNSAFSGCSSLTSVNIPVSVTIIDNYTFNDCVSLVRVNIPDGVTTIGSYAFSSCSNLTNINIPDTVTTIGSYAFSYCDKLVVYCKAGSAAATQISSFIDPNYPDFLITQVTGEDGSCSITLKKYVGSNTYVTIPSQINGFALTHIGDLAFYNCTNMTNVSIADSVATIGSNAFAWCSSLSNVEISNSATSIGSYAFLGCSSLERLTIPASVKTLGDGIINSSAVIWVCILSENIDFSSNTFPKDANKFDTQSPLILAPADSTTYQKLQEYGCLCGLFGSEITLNDPLSQDSFNPTHILALDNATLDLSSKQNYTITRVLEYFTRADLPRNDGMHDEYLTRYTISDNVWKYNAMQSFWNRSILILEYVDASGNTVCSDPYYVEFGVADMAEPVILSPLFESSHDGYATVPQHDLEIVWTDIENCTYDVILFEYVFGGSSTWRVDGLSGNTCTIPQKYLEPGTHHYRVNVYANNIDTGEQVDYNTNGFQVYGSGVVTDYPELTSPIANQYLHSGEYAPVLNYDGDMIVSWKPVKNAISYKAELLAEYKNSSRFTWVYSQSLTGTSVTIPSSTLDRWINRSDIGNFSIVISAYDRYGHCLGDTKWHQFHFRNGDAPSVKVDGGAVSDSPDIWTSVSAGKHVVQWTEVQGAASYRIALQQDIGRTYYGKPGKSTSNLSYEVELEDNSLYILVLHALDASGKVINGGWYYMSVNRNINTKPELSVSIDDYIDKQDIPVSWTDVGAVHYTVSLNKKMPGDANEDYGVFGDKNPYYSQTILTQTNPAGCSYTFPASALEYGAMYRILLSATYSDGETKTVDHLFKVTGDPEYLPDVQGVVCSTDSKEPALNLKYGWIIVKWPEETEAVRYEAALYTTDSQGTRLDMQAVKRSKNSSLAIYSEYITDNATYELALKSYDKDGFSNEYRLYFELKGAQPSGTLTLPASIKIIKEEAFANNTSINTIVVSSSSLESIEKRAFSECSNLFFIDLPESVSYIASDAFDGCAGLTIHCTEGSYVHKWCSENGIEVILK